MPFYLYEKEGADCIIFLLVLDENTFYNYNVRDEFYESLANYVKEEP